MLHHKAFFFNFYLFFLFYFILGLLLWAVPLQRAYWTATVKGKTGCA